MDDNKIRFSTEKYENEQSIENVEGVTVMIDRKFKQMLDIKVKVKS